MNIFVIVLRIIHIFAGVFWVGAAATFVMFLAPTAAATRPESQKFMNYLLQQRQFLNRLVAAATLGILAGLLLYWQDSGGFSLNWITTPTGLGFTLGATAAVIAFAGLLMARDNLKRLGALSRQIQSSGQPPTPDQAAQLQRLQERQSRLGAIGLALLTVALLGMATARYL
jgi:uncharacterized membrane protein